MTLIHDWNDCWACNRHHSIVFLSQWLHYLVIQEFVQHVQSGPLLVIVVVVVAGLIAGTAVTVVNVDCHCHCCHCYRLSVSLLSVTDMELQQLMNSIRSHFGSKEVACYIRYVS